jgi:hypothetical protein
MTDQTKHTPGPWEYATRFTAKATGPLQMIGPDPECRHIADIPRNGDQQRQEADARLIAAAPEMLAALGELVAEWDAERAEQDSPQTGFILDTLGIEMARAAIAKATGREE